MSKPLSESKKPIIIALFHWNSCHACVKFKPIWDEMKKNAATQEFFDFVDFETQSQDFDELSDEAKTINKQSFDTVPTIKIVIFKKEFKYLDENKRTPKMIYKFILEKLKEMVANKEILTGGKNTLINQSEYVDKSTQTNNPIFSKNMNNENYKYTENFDENFLNYDNQVIKNINTISTLSEILK